MPVAMWPTTSSSGSKNGTARIRSGNSSRSPPVRVRSAPCPVTVIVRSAGEEATSLTFDGTQRIVFGRGASCDVRLPDPSVSYRHAYLRADGGEFLLFDEGSTNGTHVGDVRIAPRTSRVVRSGAIVRMGRIRLELRMDGAPVTREVAASTRDLALSLVSRALAVAGHDTAMAVRVVEGPDQGSAVHLREGSREYTVGRGAECDLVLEDADASRLHLCVRRDGERVSVKDLESKNGSWLGGSRLAPGQEVSWGAAIMLRIGRTVLALERPVHDALAQIEGVADEQVPELREPGIETIGSALPEGGSHEGASAGGSGLDAAASVAGVAFIPPRSSGPGVGRRGRWSMFDILVVVASLTVLGLSLAGLVWLLRS